MNARHLNLDFAAYARPRSGLALPVIVVVLFMVTVIALGLMELARFEGVVATRNRQHLQALNLAEAGLHWAVAKLGQSSQWQGDQLALGPGTATVAVADAPEMGADWLLVTSVGASGVEQKVVEQYVKVPPSQAPSALRDYAVYWPNAQGTDWTIGNHAHIVGPIFLNGNLDVSRHGSVTGGDVLSTGTVSGAGTYQLGDLPDPLPQEAQMDTSFYDQQIAFAAQQPAGNLTIGAFSYDFGGNTVYVNGDVVVSAPSVSGPGRIVATGDILVQAGVEIVGGLDLFAGQELRIIGGNKVIELEGQQDNVLYGGQGIELNNHSYVLGRGMLLSPGLVKVDNLSAVEGLVWAGSFHLGNHSTVAGVIHAESFHEAQLRTHTSIVHDPSKLPGSILPGMAGGAGPGASMERGAWTES